MRDPATHASPLNQHIFLPVRMLALDVRFEIILPWPPFIVSGTILLTRNANEAGSCATSLRQIVHRSTMTLQIVDGPESIFVTLTASVFAGEGLVMRIEMLSDIRRQPKGA